tara:strand:- start:7407 stop:7538 length:132 start_codon:yes stop_codon:yes gene_type:complete
MLIVMKRFNQKTCFETMIKVVHIFLTFNIAENQAFKIFIKGGL